MNRNTLSVCLVVALVLILSSVITASAQQPRAVPPNDNVATPTSIMIGNAYTVPDIGAATNEVGEVTASCKGGLAIPHSVWFTFSLPTTSFVSISTFGTLLFKPDKQGIDTVLAVYEPTGSGAFTERACNDNEDGSAAAHLTFFAGSGITYYVAAGTYETTEFLPESTLKLTTRMLSTSVLPPNLSFETPIPSSDWTLKNGSDDQVVCDDPTYSALTGSCAFRFIGTPGITTKLTHTMAALPFAPRKNAFLSTGFYFRVVDTPSLGTTKVKLIVRYSDGTPPSIQSVNLTGFTATPIYAFRMVTFALKSRKVASLKLVVKFGSSTGGLLFDYFDYSYFGDPGARTRGLLPVPPAAK